MSGFTHRPVLHSRTIRLGYGDTDPSGLLYYATWFPKIENLQTEFMFLQGLRQDTLQERFGWATVTRATECEYLIAVGLFEEIRIDLRIGSISTSSFSFDYEMRRTIDDALVARASITIVTISAELTAVRIPAELHAKLTSWTLKETP